MYSGSRESFKENNVAYCATFLWLLLKPSRHIYAIKLYEMNSKQHSVCRWYCIRIIHIISGSRSGSGSVSVGNDEMTQIQRAEVLSHLVHEYVWWTLMLSSQKTFTDLLLSAVTRPALQGSPSVWRSPPPSWSAPERGTVFLINLRSNDDVSNQISVSKGKVIMVKCFQFPCKFCPYTDLTISLLLLSSSAFLWALNFICKQITDITHLTFSLQSREIRF